MVGAKVNFLKLVCSSWRIWRLVLLKIVVVRVSRKNFLSKSLGYGSLSGPTIDEFLGLSLWLLLLYAWKKREEVLG